MNDTEDSMNTNNRSVASSMPPAAPGLPEYQGVRGWLLFFCLMLTFFAPFLTIATTTVTYREVSGLFAQYPRLEAVTWIDIILNVGVRIFGIYAGIRLWRVRPGAVQAAKLFLLAALAHTAIAAILPFQVGFPAEAKDAMIAEASKSFTQSGVPIALWFMYLRHSKRVKATYGI